MRGIGRLLPGLAPLLDFLHCVTTWGKNRKIKSQLNRVSSIVSTLFSSRNVVFLFFFLFFFSFFFSFSFSFVCVWGGGAADARACSPYGHSFQIHGIVFRRFFQQPYERFYGVFCSVRIGKFWRESIVDCHDNTL